MISDHGSNLSPIVERHLKPGLGGISVDDLTMAMADEFDEDLLLGVESSASPWRSAPHDVSVLRSMLHWPRRTIVLGLRVRR
jgi:hypothetical protein